VPKVHPTGTKPSPTLSSLLCFELNSNQNARRESSRAQMHFYLDKADVLLGKVVEKWGQLEGCSVDDERKSTSNMVDGDQGQGQKTSEGLTSRSTCIFVR
jgi:hypothetical protein